MGTEFEKLKESPLYNLSMANKELFHSNFIAWFGKMYPTHFINLINKLLPEKENNWFDGNPNELRIEREYKHFDISVFKDKELKLVIENKVKSIPTKKQLDNYEKVVNNQKVAFILLTMNVQLYELDGNLENKELNWNIVNYTDLSKCLSEVVNEEDIAVDYHKELLKDYCTYISNLQSVIDANTEEDHLFCNNYEKLKELGIHDVCGKRNMQSVYNGLVKHIKDSGITVVDDTISLNDDNVLVAWNYTNAPLIEVKFKHHKDYVLIQIQDKQYRHAVEFFDEEIGDRIIYNKDKYGFYPSEDGIKYLKEKYPIFFGEGALENYPFDATEFGMKDKEGYCKYCNGKEVNGRRSCWVYQWVKIPEKITKKDLISAICEDTKKIRKELAK
jgi:hypothetical protein